MTEVSWRGVEALEGYMASLAPSNPTWERKTQQVADDTFSSRLHLQYSSTKSEEVQRSSPTLHPLHSGPTGDVRGSPVCIRWSPECGRYLVATRNIVAGEEVFREAPLVLVPKSSATPTCLACLRCLKEEWLPCEGCGAPLCLPHCSGHQHDARECSRLAALGLLQDPGNADLLLLLNQLLTPLRTLLFLQTSPEAEPVVEALQSNVEKRKRMGVGQKMEKRVLGALRECLGLQVDEAAVRHICGAFDTNAFVVGDARALLPLAAIMNHDCQPNTQHWYSNGVMIVRAARDILEGTLVTNTYTPTLWGTRARAAYLASSKLFMCRCQRCLDPRELGSHLSSVRCKECQDGLLVPPLSPRSAWDCEKCSANVSGAAVEAMVRAAAVVAAKAAPGDVDALGNTLAQLRRVLGTRHYITAEIMYALVEAIMARHLYDVSEVDLLQVVDICSDLLRVADLVDPGISRFRGVLLLEKGRASAELLRRRPVDSAELSTSGSASTSLVTTTPTTTNCNNNTIANTTAFDGQVVCGHTHTPSLQDLLEAAKESEVILLHDCRLPHALDLLSDLHDLLECSERPA